MQIYKTSCILKREGTKKQVVISTSYHSKETPCFAIFDLTTLTWDKVQEESSFPGPSGHLLSFENDTRILYLGGFDINGNKLRTVYELIDNNHWKLWSQQLALPIGNDTIINVDPKFSTKCQPPDISLGR